MSRAGKTPSEEKLKQRDSDIIGYDFQCSVQKVGLDHGDCGR